MTKEQKDALDYKDEDGLRSMISILTATNFDGKDEIIKYCETRLESLNVDGAMASNGELKVGEV